MNLTSIAPGHEACEHEPCEDCTRTHAWFGIALDVAYLAVPTLFLLFPQSKVAAMISEGGYAAYLAAAFVVVLITLVTGLVGCAFRQFRRYAIADLGPFFVGALFVIVCMVVIGQHPLALSLIAVALFALQTFLCIRSWNPKQNATGMWILRACMAAAICASLDWRFVAGLAAAYALTGYWHVRIRCVNAPPPPLSATTSVA